MWKSNLTIDKYQYARTNSFLIRLIGVTGIFAALLMAIGFVNFLKLSPWYLIIFGPVVFVFIGNKILRYAVQLFYQKFDIKTHEDFVNNFWRTHSEPSVDVFLPWAGEDLMMHEEVLKAVSVLDYKNYQVYMLDDVGSEEHKALCKKYKFNYLSRPNKGVFKKSGNLQYGYTHSKSQFVLILDADFIPIKDALKDLVPYIATDNQIGILQTPQYFEQTKEIHNRSKIEFGGGNIVEEFYRIVMPSRDEFNAAMCVGTSALYRRSTILSLQGTPKVHASEDLATGLIITNFGYHVKYLPLIVSMGKSPETFQGYFKQHMRWCSGNLVFARYWPKANLNLMARLIYLTNPLHYLSEALTVIFSFQLLALLYFHSDSLSIAHTIYFLPYIILTRFFIPLTKKNKNRVGTRLAALNNSYTYFYTYIRMIFKGLPTWQPSGVRTSALSSDFVSAINLGTVISVLYVFCFIFVIQSNLSMFGNFHTYVVLGWSFYSVFWHVIYLTSVAKYTHSLRLSNVTNPFSKAFVYARTNVMSALLVVLLISSVPRAVVSLSDPASPTVAAINQFRESPPDIRLIASISTLAYEEERVLGTQSEIKKEKKLRQYFLTVRNGETLRDLSERVLGLYSEEMKVSLTPKQLNFAASLIAREIDIDSLKIDQIVVFDKEIVEKSVNQSVAEITVLPTQSPN